ncbi:hypothetical protein FALBO_8937 [Fusarium albosuccineum]|uniref:Ubiquitin-like domain-containing protein n=1 Tax=Fusarium albosuccineum TaxID=1237068 RepID=A0A8H4L9Y7_9HYPO|nr:hypothetical protein FALBO_8937 [Fusarium albosuccineum]
MAAPGFGFSAGDFISAVKLISDITKALKDTGGAAENHCGVLTDLNLLKDVLEQLQREHTVAASSSTNNPFVTHARRQASLTLSTLADFLNVISKFGAKLGPQRPSPWYRGVGRKAQWAVVYAKHVDDLRMRVGTQLQTLSILTQLKERSTAAIIDLDAKLSEMKIQNDEILRRCSKWDTPMDGLERSPRPLNNSNQQANPNNNETNLIPYSRGDTTLSGSRGVWPVTYEPLDSLATRFDQAIENFEQRCLQRLGPEPSTTIFSIHDSKHPTDQGAISHHTQTGQEEDTLRSLLLKLAHVMARDLRDLVVKAWLLFPHLMTFYRWLSTTITTPPMLIVAESINFEDVLGRKVTLQYDFFRHWPNFNAFLHSQFQNCPGESYVAKKQYYILDAQTTDHVDSDVELAWRAMALPGCEISMNAQDLGVEASPKGYKAKQRFPVQSVA